MTVVYVDKFTYELYTKSLSVTCALTPIYVKISNG